MAWLCRLRVISMFGPNKSSNGSSTSGLVATSRKIGPRLSTLESGTMRPSRLRTTGSPAA